MKNVPSGSQSMSVGRSNSLPPSRPLLPSVPRVVTNFPSYVNFQIRCCWSSMIQTCFSGSYGFILILCDPRPQLSWLNILSRCGHSPTILPLRSTMKTVWCQRRSHPRFGVGSQVALNPSVLPVALPRDGDSNEYGVHGFASLGSGNSPRCAIQIRSGVSAYTAPPDPQVQPWCSPPSPPPASGCGQFSTSS